MQGSRLVVNMDLQGGRSNDSVSSTGRFFVIGPPVQHVPAVRNVIKRALEVTSQGEEDYEFTKLIVFKHS